MDYNELKTLVLSKIKEYPDYKERAIRELSKAKNAYEENFNVVDYINDLAKENNVSDAYVIPFFLGLTDKVDLTKPLEIRQIREGDSGGVDIDTDISARSKPLVKAHLEELYGKDRVIQVGAYGTVGLKSAIKDILKYEQIPFAESNEFCKYIDDEMSFEDNMKEYQKSHPAQFNIYLKHKEKLDIASKMSSMIRNQTLHAAGILITDKPVYEYIPVMKASDSLGSAFVESGSATDLDSIGLTKYDLLGLQTVDVIDDAIDMIDEELFEIEEDGVVKIVPASYLEGKEIENNI